MDKKNLIWLIPVMMVFIALFSMPYGYYKLVRLALCAFSIFLAYKEHEIEPKNIWVWVLGATAVIYNPIIPLHLGRDVWSFVNVATIGVFIIHWKQRKIQIKLQLIK